MKTSDRDTIYYSKETPARTGELHSIRDVVEHLARTFGFDDVTAHNIALAVDEACANIIEHAYAGDESGRFRLEIRSDRNDFIVTLTDNGKPFPLLSRSELNIRSRMGHLNRGGLGLHIIERVMDHVLFDRRNEHTNCLQLVKHRRRA